MGQQLEIEVNGVRKFVDEDILVKRHAPQIDNEVETTDAQEWYLDGVLVKRDVQMILKKLPVESGTDVGDMH